MTDVHDVIAAWLRCHGYDGLFNSDLHCACLLEDLCPCGEPSLNECRAGHKLAVAPDCAEGCSFHVGVLKEQPGESDEPVLP